MLYGIPRDFNINFARLKIGILFLPGFEPGTFRVWGERDNHYTTETHDLSDTRVFP